MTSKRGLTIRVNIYFGLALSSFLWGVLASIILVFCLVTGNWSAALEAAVVIAGCLAIFVPTIIAGDNADRRLELLDGRRQPPSPYAGMDKVIADLSAAAVVAKLPESIRADFMDKPMGLEHGGHVRPDYEIMRRYAMGAIDQATATRALQQLLSSQA